MVSDKISDPTPARKLGRGFLRALSGLFGRRNVLRAQASAQLLRDEFEAGRRAAEHPESPRARRVPHRDLGRVSDPEEPAPFSGGP